MTLLGRWNWWSPRALRRLHGRIGIQEGPQLAVR
jgi:RND superfamily putative drug exporter